MKSQRRQRGFTLLELAVGMAVAGLILIPMTNYFVQQVNQRMVSQAASDTLSIGEAAQNYQADNGSFPDQAHNCAAALSVLASNGYLGNGTNSTAWAGTYGFACPTTGSGTVFNITIATPTQNDAQSLLRQVVRGSIPGGTNNVVSSFPVASNAPALAQLLHRYSTPGHPEYNQMEVPIDMNANAINNGGQVTSVASGTAFYATAGTVRSDVASSTAPAFYAPNGYFETDQTDTTRPAVYAKNSYIESDRPVGSGPAFYTPGGQFASGVAAGSNAFTTPNGNYYTQNGKFQSDTTGVAFQATNGSMQWGPNGNMLATNQGGAIELGANNGVANASGATPYIDFHYGNGAGQDYNTRIINDADQQLTAVANMLHVGSNGSAGNIVADGQVAASNVLTTYKGVRTLTQAVQDTAIVDAADTAANRTFSETCPTGETPDIYTAISQVAEGNPAYPLNQVVTYATANGTSTTSTTITTSWTVSMQVMASDPNNTNYQTPPAGYGRILVVTKCT